LKGLRPWKKLDAGVHTIPLGGSDKPAASIHVRIPPDDDPTVPHDLALILPDRGMTVDDAWNFADAALNPGSRPLILATLAAPPSIAFDQPLAPALDVPAWLRAIRTRIHVDPSRVFLVGRGRSADAGWLIACSHPHLFAGALLRDGYPSVPYPDQLYPLLVDNLRCVHVLAITAAESSQPGASEPTAANHVARITQIARAKGVTVEHVVATPTVAAAKLDLATPPDPRFCEQQKVALWFRFPQHGDCGWLRVLEMRGEPWRAQQISIHPGPSTDHDAFIARVLRSQLGQVSGAIHGQEVVIRSHRVGKLRLALSPGLMDLTKPVVVSCNDVKRFEGMLTPSIDVLLQSIAETWNFENPTVAVLTLSVQTDADPPQ
jgi:hypothetical protein